MIDFAGIPRRVCSDSRLRQDFLNDPLGVTEQLLQEDEVARAIGPDEPRSASQRNPAASRPPEESADILLRASA